MLSRSLRFTMERKCDSDKNLGEIKVYHCIVSHYSTEQELNNKGTGNHSVDAGLGSGVSLSSPSQPNPNTTQSLSKP